MSYYRAPPLQSKPDPPTSTTTNSSVIISDDEFSAWLNYPLQDSFERSYCSDASEPQQQRWPSSSSSVRPSSSSQAITAAAEMNAQRQYAAVPVAAGSIGPIGHGAFMAMSRSVADTRTSLSRNGGATNNNNNGRALTESERLIQQRSASAEGALAMGAQRAAGLVSSAAVGSDKSTCREVVIKVRTMQPPPTTTATPLSMSTQTERQVNSYGLPLSASSSSTSPTTQIVRRSYRSSSGSSASMAPAPKLLLQRQGFNSQAAAAPLILCPSSRCCSSSSLVTEEAPGTAASEYGSSSTAGGSTSELCAAAGGGGQSINSVVTEVLSHRNCFHGGNGAGNSAEYGNEAVEQKNSRGAAAAAAATASGNEVEDGCEWRSDDLDDDESLDIKPQQQLPRSSSSSKRNRTAEVHNLSERNRRNRINEKLRALQSLIPNSTKTDKASVLDEAIEYMKTLQMQLQQMASMRTAMNVTPMMIPIDMPHLPMAPQTIGLGLPVGHPGMAMGIGQADAYQSVVPGISHFGMPFADPRHLFPVVHNPPHIPNNAEFDTPADAPSMQQPNSSQLLDEQGYTRAQSMVYGMDQQHYVQAAHCFVHHLHDPEQGLHRQYHSPGAFHGYERQEHCNDKTEEDGE